MFVFTVAVVDTLIIAVIIGTPAVAVAAACGGCNFCSFCSHLAVVVAADVEATVVVLGAMGSLVTAAVTVFVIVTITLELFSIIFLLLLLLCLFSCCCY